MRTAKLYVAVIEFTCPYCDEHICNKDHNSHMFEIFEPIGDTLFCGACMKTSKTPKRLEQIRKGN